MKILRKRKIAFPKGFFQPNCSAFIVEVRFNSYLEKSARKWRIRKNEDEIVKLLILTVEESISTIMEVDNFVLRELLPCALRHKVAEFLLERIKRG